jgi:hypothetical protein
MQEGHRSQDDIEKGKGKGEAVAQLELIALVIL